MLFNSYIFIFLFLPVCLIGFYAMHRRNAAHGREHWLVWINLCSLVFYGYWSLTHLAVFIASLLVNFTLSAPIASKNKAALIGGVSFNLALLGYFKYTDFLIDQVNFVSGADIGLLGIVLPIGISFFTFQQIAYLVDLYQGKAPPAPFMRYVFFISFFPQLIAGPIVHHQEIFPQLSRYKNHIRNLTIGLSIFSIGLFKKVIIADTLALSADSVFDFAARGGQPTLIEAWYGTLTYALQIYFDFSAYTDMAIGLARMFGLRLPQNFASPYKAVSVIDFWRRWHITLSRFLRDYLYIPLGGNRHGPARRYLNVFITMVIGGFWHGASWNFVIWGALHGIFLIVNQWARSLIKLRIPPLFSWALTTLCVLVAWVPFRAADLSASIRMWKGMSGLGGTGYTLLPQLDLALITLLQTGALTALAVLICLCLPNSAEIFRRYNAALPTKGYDRTYHAAAKIFWRPTALWGIWTAALLWLSLLKLGEPSAFLYFQF